MGARCKASPLALNADLIRVIKFEPTQADNDSQRGNKQPVKSAAQPEGPTVSPTLTPALPEPIPPSTTSLSASPEEIVYFDKVKKFLNNKNTMNEFLKLLNLFSSDLIDRNTLVHRVQSFIGKNAELFTYFKRFVGYNGRDEIIENRARPVSGKVQLNNCRGLGPSYRLLPKNVGDAGPRWTTSNEPPC